MDSIYRSLIEAIVYIASREVPDEIEDDDVRALESICAELALTESKVKARFIQIAGALRDDTEDLPRKQALESLLEFLES